MSQKKVQIKSLLYHSPFGELEFKHREIYAVFETCKTTIEMNIIIFSQHFRVNLPNLLKEY